MSVAAALSVAALAWFGPAQVSFEAALDGNPYDFRANDVRVTFVAADGHREERLAYFDDGAWKAWLVTTHPAVYEATLTHNGSRVGTAPVNVAIPAHARIPGGYVRVQGTRFAMDDGTPYFPLGHNLGWQQPQTPTLVMQLRDMGAAGMNWTRIWACAWDGKNPFFSLGMPPPPPGELLPGPLRQWDELFAAAEDASVRVQLVLFHHGMFSTEVNPNWDQHTWNAANGGFLARPQDFFTDATAREYTQRWLRHAVARWGHSPALLAWELFNEVEWVDRVRKDHDWATVAAWHADMATFLRGIDPYRHLITTSSATEHPALYDAMDYFQPHLYTRNLTVAIAGMEPLPDKPWFYGEFGGDAFGPAAPDESSITRDGLWASILSGHAGAAGYWYWERVVEQRFAHEFTRAARVLELSNLPARADAKPITIGVSGAQPAPLKFAPGRGWGQTDSYTFHLPADATPARLAQLSSYLRAPNPKRPQIVVAPLTVHFTAPTAAEATLTLIGVGPNGSGLQVLLDGHEIFNESWPATTPSADGSVRTRPALPAVTIPYQAGAHVITMRCSGPDWVQFGEIAVPDLGTTSRAMAIGDADGAVIRLTSDPAGVPGKLALTIPGLEDGKYTVTCLDLDNGTESQRSVDLQGGTLPWEVVAPDVVLILKR